MMRSVSNLFEQSVSRNTHIHTHSRTNSSLLRLVFIIFAATLWSPSSSSSHNLLQWLGSVRRTLHSLCIVQTRPPFKKYKFSFGMWREIEFFALCLMISVNVSSNSRYPLCELCLLTILHSSAIGNDELLAMTSYWLVSCFRDFITRIPILKLELTLIL